MYIEQLDTFYIEIPKTGTSSVNYTIHGMQYQPLAVRGHMPVSHCVDFLGRAPSRVTCCIRHPVDRLVSAVRFFCVDIASLDYWMNILAKRNVEKSDGQFPHDLFKSQENYLDADVDVDLYPFEDLQKLVESLGWRGTVPHENVSQDKICRDDVLCHPCFEDVFARHYSGDQRLYDSLRGSVDVK